MGNKGAFLRFKAPDMKPDVVTFSAVVSILRILSLYFWLKFLNTIVLSAFLKLTKWLSNFLTGSGIVRYLNLPRSPLTRKILL